MDELASIDLALSHQHLLQKLLMQWVPGVAVWAYGSRIQGTARRYSDLDLVVFTPPEQTHQFWALKEALDESDLPFLVDLHRWHALPESFRRVIRDNHVVVQASGERLASRPPQGRPSPVR